MSFVGMAGQVEGRNEAVKQGGFVNGNTKSQNYEKFLVTFVHILFTLPSAFHRPISVLLAYKFIGVRCS